MTDSNKPAEELTDDGLKALARALRISFNILVIVMVCSLLFFLWRSLFVVESNEVGILLRFGNVVSKDGNSVLKKGPHFAWPYPIDTQIRVPTGSQTVTVETFAGNAKAQDVLVPGTDGYSLTGDMNILHSQWTFKYRVVDPLSYALKFPDADNREQILKTLLRSAVTHSATSLSIDTALYDRERFRQQVRRTLAERLNRIGAGVDIEQLIFNPAPPKKLEEAFQSVTNAEERKNRDIAQSRGDVQKLLSDAAVTKEEVIARARQDKAETIATASADAEVFTKLYKQYSKNPELFRKLYYEEKLKRILGNVDETFIVDRRKNRSLYLELNPEPRKSGANDSPDTD